MVVDLSVVCGLMLTLGNFGLLRIGLSQYRLGRHR
jgi:hypothetical protein